MRFDLLTWLAEPKSDRTRYGAAFGCVGAALFGIPLLTMILAFGAIAHCKTCGSATGGNLIAGLAAAFLFGVACGASSLAARGFLQRLLGRLGAAICVSASIIAAAYLTLQPALTIITT